MRKTPGEKGKPGSRMRDRHGVTPGSRRGASAPGPLRPTGKWLESGRPRPSTRGSWFLAAPAPSLWGWPGQEWSAWVGPGGPYLLLCRLDMVLTSGSPLCPRRRRRRRPRGTRGSLQKPPTGNEAASARVPSRPAPPRPLGPTPPSSRAAPPRHCGGGAPGARPRPRLHQVRAPETADEPVTTRTLWLLFARPWASVSIYAVYLSPRPLPYPSLPGHKLLRHCFKNVDLPC